jgi:hypothetical protein
MRMQNITFDNVLEYQKDGHQLLVLDNIFPSHPAGPSMVCYVCTMVERKL